MAATAWPAAPADLEPAHRFVDLWRVRLQDQPARRMACLLATLCDDERQRAERFALVRRRNEFVVTRGLLRTVLGRLAGVAPERLAFAIGEHGKPFLKEPAATGLSFNLSHSHGVGLVAVTVGRAVGVDVELDRPKSNYAALSRRFFSERESATLLGLPASQRQRAFFACWTRKEAFVKAQGTGIALGLDRFDVALRPDQPAALLRTCWDPGEAARWSLVNVEIGGSHAAALAVAGDGFEVRCWDGDGAPAPCRL